MDEIQLWNNWQSGRLADGVIFIGTIIAIWLALRVANLTRENPETDTIAKVVSSVFCLVVVYGSWVAYTVAANTWTLTAGALNALDNRTEVADGFIEYVGVSGPVSTPSPEGMIFLAVVTVMCLVLIWRPKKT